MDKLSERLTKECDRITSRQYMGADRWVNTFAHSTEVRVLMAEAIELAKRYEDAPVGNCVACDFEGYERPTWHVIDDREAVPLTLRGRVRIVLDKEG